MDQKTVVQPVHPYHGQTIKMPGIYKGIPFEKYHSGTLCIEPSISSSGLRTIFLKSPAHFWATSPLNPERIEDEESAALTVGRATHHLLFGEEGFRKRFAVRPDTMGGVKWTGKGACKIWMEERAKEGRSVILSRDMAAIEGMAKSLFREPLVKAGLLNGDIERSLIWKDKETGIWLKSRPDAMPNDSLDFVDLKTTASVMWPDLQRAIYDYGYYQQAALVNWACLELFRVPMAHFTLVFVEKKPPHCVQIVTLKEADIQRGMRANRKALMTFAECLKTGNWPGPQGSEWIEMLEYQQKQIDTKLTF